MYIQGKVPISTEACFTTSNYVKMYTCILPCCLQACHIGIYVKMPFYGFKQMQQNLCVLIYTKKQIHILQIFLNEKGIFGMLPTTVML